MVSEVPPLRFAVPKALAANRLPIKIYGGPDVGALESIQALQLPTGFGSPYLKLGPIKLFADGSVGARTAALSHPYEDEPGHLGQLVWETEALHRVIASAHNAGLQIAVHALGDRGITATVDAFEAAFAANPRPNHRHRIEHCELLTPTLMERIADLGLIVSAQPNFVGEWGFPDGLYETRLGWERVSRMNPFGELARRGLPMAFGSDCMPFHPLYGIWSAVAHPIPEYRLTPYEALRHYTQSAAYAAFEEKIKGTINPGMVADLAVLSADATTIDVDGIRDIEVEMTMIDGKVWYVKRDV
ncbi:amidohydrolase family protein [Candidatus Poribacteria bacterium]|nr:amidohydrolase family protein [Candidatus Poribacteria bacterium]